MDGAQNISSALSTFSLAKSADAVDMEDLLVVSLFASRDVEGKNAFVPQILGDTFNHSGEMLRVFGHFIKNRRKKSNKSDLTEHISLELINTLKTMEHFTHLGDPQLAVLQWCICAYTMAMHPTSPVDVRVNPEKEFVLLARTPIQAGQVIYEAIGMMPGDDGVVSKFTSITVAPEQNQEVGAKRTLYGPLRMARHRCQDYNAEFMPLKGTSAFVLQAKCVIPAGEEITLNYGARTDCACADCKLKDIEQLGDAWQSCADETTTLPSGNHHPSLLSALQRRHVLIKQIDGPGERERERKYRKDRQKRYNKIKLLEIRLAKEKASHPEIGK